MNCFQMKLHNNSRVKQHINRNHTRSSFYCQRCFSIFKDEPSLDAHVMQQSNENCIRDPEVQLEGINSWQQKLLSKNPKAPGSDESKWFEIWYIVLPNRERPKSAYIDSRLADYCSQFHKHWENNGAELLAQTIQGSGIMEMTNMDGNARNRTLRRILAEGLTTIWESWNPPRTSSQAHSYSSLHSIHGKPSSSGQASTSSLGDSGIGLRMDMPIEPHTPGGLQMPALRGHSQTENDPLFDEMDGVLVNTGGPEMDQANQFGGFQSTSYIPRLSSPPQEPRDQSDAQISPDCGVDGFILDDNFWSFNPLK
jgi:hypothetical protein